MEADYLFLQDVVRLNMRSGVWLVMLVVVTMPVATAQARVNNSMLRQYQKMQMQAYQQRAQQSQAMQQARAAKRAEHLKHVRENAQRLREKKEADLKNKTTTSVAHAGTDKNKTESKDNTPHDKPGKNAPPPGDSQPGGDKPFKSDKKSA